MTVCLQAGVHITNNKQFDRMKFSEIMQNAPFIWFIVGFVFALFELVIPGFVIAFFALGAWLTSLVCWALDINVTVQIIIFVVTSVGTLLLFRRKLKSRFFKAKKNEIPEDDDEFIGQHVVVVDEITPEKNGKVELKGANWTAKADVHIEVGKTVKVMGKESICLIVKPL